MLDVALSKYRWISLIVLGNSVCYLSLREVQLGDGIESSLPIAHARAFPRLADACSCAAIICSSYLPGRSAVRTQPPLTLTCNDTDDRTYEDRTYDDPWP